MIPIIDIENLGFDHGAHLVIKQFLRGIPLGAKCKLIASSIEWQGPLAAWCRSMGHSVKFDPNENSATITRGNYEEQRWFGAEVSSGSDLDGVADVAKSNWGLAARGATIEAGTANFDFRLNQKKEVWAENLQSLYSQAVAGQWDPEKRIDWSPKQNHSDDLEYAVVQIMTFLIENENAALVVPAKFLGNLHPHFREVQSLLAIQIADESRHIEVFNRRLKLYGGKPHLSTAGSQASLKTLLDESDFSVAGFLLTVLGEGTFVDLLLFLSRFAPDPVTREITKLAARDETRHVAFGMSHLIYHLEHEPGLRSRLAGAIEARHATLLSTSGLNSEVFDSLILLAAGSFNPTAIGEGFLSVQNLMNEMAEGRRTRLIRLGFNTAEADRLSSLHTRNFM